MPSKEPKKELKQTVPSSEPKAPEASLGLTVKKSQDFNEWYNQIVIKSEFADYSSVSGCIIFRPNSYAIWENIQKNFNDKIKKSGHQNCYFPLFIPQRLLTKEAAHVKGFTPEVAWVTKAGDTELNEMLAIRPTSETIMYESYAKWIRSWRDLPLLLNQWNNVVRWEFKHAKPFLRTREFLWQEGHTAHATEKEAEHEVMQQLFEYVDLIENIMAIPVIAGKKTEHEKFAGAVYTTTCEALMPDGKALQMATSHMLGQNFSKPFNITFLDNNETQQYAWQTSWGLSTRTIGALIMVHGDDKGLVLPPKIAPLHVVVVPILFKNKNEEVIAKAREIAKKIPAPSTVYVDEREYTPGWKFNEWELKGVPLRIEIGPRDLQNNQAVFVRRDTGEKIPVKDADITQRIPLILEDIQKNLFERAKERMHKDIAQPHNFTELKKAIADKKMACIQFCGNESCATKIKDEADGATARCIPFEQKPANGNCAVCSKKAHFWVYFAKAY